MLDVLVCWLGATDLKASRNETNGDGPVANVLAARPFDAVHLLTNYPTQNVVPFLSWLEQRTGHAAQVHYHKLVSPTDFEEIFPACRKTLKALQADYPDGLRLTFHISPGTPAMATTWIILSETEFPATLVESSLQRGVRDVNLPISLTAEWLPSYIRNRDARLEGAAPELPPVAAQFKDILHHSEVMKKVIYMASKVAPRSVPVLLEGESGTGKELFAKAIHAASLRADEPFVPINCGAIPHELIESILFGHVKGAFSGAASNQVGKFEAADGGTLFLDELGELPTAAQVRFLRVLEDGEVWPIGAKFPKKVSVRIIAATNRSLLDEISEGRFREDLFYRLAVAVIRLPPLRHRREDVKLLINHLLAKVNNESQDEPGFKDKKLSLEGQKILLGHTWPGNVRELLNTLRRLAVWSEGQMISGEEARECLLANLASRDGRDGVLGREIGQGFDLNALLDSVERHYVEKAWLESGKRKKEAAALLGIPNYQTFSKRLEKYAIE
ncbi:MAG: sigma-54 dependent transcriptional regulator [Thiohalocapsa sp.]|nr:sigma-54 dependent transcriptional regulator [Thiohalocapsa sp.]